MSDGRSVRRARHTLALYATGAVVFGAAMTLVPASVPHVAAAPADLDPSFDIDGIATTPVGHSKDYGVATAVQLDGKVVVASRWWVENFLYHSEIGVTRFNENGSLDATFGVGGTTRINLGGVDDAPRCIAIQPDGKVVVGARLGSESNRNDSPYVVLRLNSDGTPDASFGASGRVSLAGQASGNFGFAGIDQVAIQEDGKIVVFGVSDQPGNLLARLNGDGNLDESFGTGGIVTVTPGMGYRGTGMRFDADGRIVTVARHYDSGNYLVVHRFLSDGTPDPAFSGDGTLAILMPGDTNVGGPAIQADGRIIVTGNYFGVDERGTMIMRLNEDGMLDPTFGSGGFVTEIDLNGRNVALLSDGRILVLAGLDDQMIVAVRYHPDGSRDDTFGTSGVATSPAIGTYPDSSGGALVGDRALVVPGTTDTTFDSDLLVARLALTDCGDGTTNFGEQCDDGNSKSGDGCSGGCRPEFCPPSPLPSASCISAELTDLLVKASRPTKATVRFKWSHGGAIEPGELGFPDIDTTVALCLYGSSGGVSTLAVGLTVTPGSLWVAGDSGGWVYADGTGSNDGIQRAELRPGVAGTTRAALRARGRYTLAPTAASESLFISQDPVVTAQIISSDGLCLTSELTAAMTSRNAAGRFRGTAP